MCHGQSRDLILEINISYTTWARLPWILKVIQGRLGGLSGQKVVFKIHFKPLSTNFSNSKNLKIGLYELNEIYNVIVMIFLKHNIAN